MALKIKIDKVFTFLFLTLLCSLALFVPLSKPVTVYIIALLLFFWLLEKPWYFVPVFIYVAIVWHTRSAIYIASGIILVIGLVDVFLWAIKRYRLSLFYHFKEEPFRKYILSFAVLYFLYILGLLYSHNFKYAAFDLEVKFSLFIFPAVVSTLRKEVFTRQRLTYIYVFFIIGLIISILVSFGNAVIQYSQTLSTNVLYYRNLSFFHHPGYLSMFINFGIAILIFFLTKKEEFSLNIWHIVSLTFLIILFSVFNILLSSKAGILGLLIVYLITIGHLIVFEKKIWHGLALILMIGFMFYFSLQIFPYSLNRIINYKTVVDNKINAHPEDDETGDRITIWKNSIEVIKEHFLLGVGTGDVKDNLNQKYMESDSHEAFEKNLNAHNQFLQTFITLGIIGFLVLMLSIVLPGYYALKQHSFLYLIFIIIIALNFLVESMLETQAGVVFYSFFNALLFYTARIGYLSKPLAQ